jgi:TrmH family RNA methyltransferase
VAVFATKDFLSEFENCGVEVVEVSESVLEHISDAVTPQGVVAVLKIPKYAPKSLDGVSVCLDGVSDAGNLGTIMRIMTAVGVTDLFLIDCVDPYSPKTVRSSMSGIFCVKPFFVTHDEFKNLCKVPLIVADMNGESVFDIQPPKDFCLLLGSEAHGVSDEMRKLATKTLKIPMKNNLESLNVGVSAAVMLYGLLKNTF